MANDITMTIVGNLTADPELRFIPSGAAVANFTVAQTPRAFDRDANEWKDGDTIFIRCSVWRDMAENVAESLHKGDRVVVTGRFKVRPYEVEGQQRQSNELEVDEVGAAMRYASVRITKANRQQAQQGQAPAADAWSTPQGQQSQPWGGQQGQPPAWGAPPQQPQGPPQQPQGPPQGQPQQGGWGPPPQQGGDQPPY